MAGQTQLAAAIAAIKSLLASYSAFGNVMVQLVTFSDSASTPSATWMTVAQASALLDTITASGETNYDAALAAAQAAYATSGSLASGQNVVYFFSDGNPTSPTTSAGIDSTEEAAWAAFLASHDMTSYAVGMGSQVTSSSLDPVAWSTTAGTAASSVVVSDLNQLATVLQSTVPTPTGDLVSGGAINSGGHVGADGGYIHAVTIDGVTYTIDSAYDSTVSVSGGTSAMQSFNSASMTLVVKTVLGGTFTIDMDDGTYSYGVPSSVAAQIGVETLTYVVSDKDGDTQTGSLTVQVNDPSIVGTSGSDTLTGTASADYITGLGGADTIVGGAGNDTLVGGTGSDTLTGNAGSDVFAWTLNDHGSAGKPAVDTIADFDVSADIIDLRDLLAGEGSGSSNTVGNLENYLEFSVSGTTTTIHVSSTGGFTNGTYSAAAEDQTIVLQGVDLTSALGLTSGATDAQIITTLLTQGKLVVDPASGT
jgi:Ca2+-binding RTX toxin-like protein